MKRLAILAILAAFILGTVATASAVELKAAGSWRIHANWLDNTDFNDDDGASEDDFAVGQRARIYFDFIANENLKGVLKLEIGDLRWGNGGAAPGTDAVAIEVKNAYVDFNIPDTEVNIKAGLMGVALPNTLGSSIFDEDVAALVVNVPFNDMIALTVGWARLADNNIEDPATTTTTTQVAVADENYSLNVLVDYNSSVLTNQYADLNCLTR